MTHAPANSNVVALPARRPKPVRLGRGDTEFLPAALEIIETPASPVGRAIAGTIIAFAAIAVGWACVGEVDIIATAQGRVIPTGKSKVIQPFETGVVRAIAVHDGSVVKAGDVLVEMDPTADGSDEARARFALAEDRLDLARLRALLEGTPFAAPDETEPQRAAMARRQGEAQAAEQRARLDGLDRQVAQKEAEGREVRAALAKVEADLPLLSEQRDIRASYLQREWGNRLSYLQVQQQLVETQHEGEVQREKRDEVAQALAALQQGKAEAAAAYRKGLLADLAKAELSAREHGEDLAKAGQKRALRTLRAPVAGTVQQLAVHTLGGVVTPAQQLLVVVPAGTGLEIEATLPNKDVGFVHAGQAVEVKVEAFTFTRYGLLRGQVTAVSQDAVADEAAPQRNGKRESEAQNDEQARQAGQASYVALVSLDRAVIRTEDGETALEPGMAVTAEIKTGRRTVISYLLSPLLRMQQEEMRER